MVGGIEVVGTRRAARRYPPHLFIRQSQILGSTTGSFGEFGDLLALARRSGLKAVIDSEFALDDVPLALTRLEFGAQFGKIVVDTE